MASSDDVQVLSFWPSPFYMRAQLALAAKDIPFTSVHQDLKDKSPLLLQYNPVHKKVPVLLHNGRPVCESVLIVEYVDEAFPSPEGRNLLPDHPYDRAVARFWGDFIDKKVFGGMVKVFTSSGDELGTALEELRDHINTLEEKGFAIVDKEVPYFGGTNVGFVDIVLGPVVVAIPLLEALTGVKLVDKAPRVAAWMEAFQDLPVAACLPPLDKMMELSRSRFGAQKQVEGD